LKIWGAFKRKLLQLAFHALVLYSSICPGVRHELLMLHFKSEQFLMYRRRVVELDID